MSIAPPLSIVVTTYRRAHELGKTLDSILAQSFGDFELIVSDDASPDATEDLVREYVARDSRVRYRRNAKNLNMPGNLNAGLREARAPLVANLHDGDVYRPDLLARWKEALDAQPDAAFVFNGCELMDEEGRAVRLFRHKFGPRIEVRQFVDYVLRRLAGSGEDVTDTVDLREAPPRPSFSGKFFRMLAGPFDSPVWGTVMARRSAYEEAGYFNPRYAFISDVDMWLRLNLRYPVAYISEPLISLAPRGKDRPHGYLSWKLERALMGIYEDCIDRVFFDEPAKVAHYRTLLRRIRDRRWLYLAATSLRHGRLDVFDEALEMFREEDSGTLRALGYLGPRLKLLAPDRRG